MMDATARPTYGDSDRSTARDTAKQNGGSPGDTHCGCRTGGQELSPSDRIKPPAKNKQKAEHPLLQNRTVQIPERESQPEQLERNRGDVGKTT